jgi:small subunit ribosomal protein S3
LGQKVNPIGFRLGVIKGWQSRWYAERDYKDIYKEDYQIRQLINKELANASVSRIEIERAAANQVSVTVYTAKPGIVIGKSGEKVDRLRTTLEAKTKKRVRLNIMEIRQPELDAFLVARSIAEQLERRVSFRRAMKMAAQKTMRANAKGIRILAGGRLGGAEIARSEKEVVGKIPLQTLRADIDYGVTEAHTTFGVIGIKVWIYKGDVLPTKRREPGEAAQEQSTTQAYQPRERDGGERRGSGDRRRSEGSGYRGERGQRPQGDRPQGGDRGERGPRQQGDRPARPQGERRPRPQGQGDQPRPQGQGQGGQGGERPPRQPRPQGERSQRPQGARPPRQRQEQSAQAGQVPATPSQPTEPEVTSSIPATTPTPEATTVEATSMPTPEATTPGVPSTPAPTPAPETTAETDSGSAQSE